MDGELKRIRSAQPFVPFAVVMSDGTHITAKHPKMALLTKHWLHMTTDSGERTEDLALLRITRVWRRGQAA